MKVEIPDHEIPDAAIMLASMGYYMIADAGNIPTHLFILARIFNQMMEDRDGKGDFFETIAQKFPDVAEIIRDDVKAQATSNFKDWS